MKTHDEAIQSILPPEWTARPATRADVDAAVELSNARSQAFYGENQATRDGLLASWSAPRTNLDRDTLLAFDASGALAGMASVDDSGEPYARISCSAVTHPRVADRPGLWDGLHGWALRRAREFVPLARPEIRVAAETAIARQDEARAASLERMGFAAVRVANRMRIDLESPVAAPAWPDGIVLRTADVERDLRDLVALFLEAWRDHWGFVARPFDRVLDDWRQGILAEGERFDPTLWFLATEGSEIVGISLCSACIADDWTRGYVQGLGVRPAWRKRGVALALLRHTFGEFRRRGYAAVELDMDSENLTGALRVYERAGMRATRQSVVFERELRPGRDLATRELAR